MAQLRSSPTLITVNSPSSWRPPYALPTAPGTFIALDHPNVNYVVDVRAPFESEYVVHNAGFCRGYGGGTFMPTFGNAGAWVVAGAGGHRAGQCRGGFIFDFGTGRWLPRVAPAQGEPQTSNDPPASALSGWAEFPGYSPPLPAAGHIESFQWFKPGSTDTIIRAQAYAADIDSLTGSSACHQFNLTTGLWSRLSTNVVVSPYGKNFFLCMYDSVSNMYYMPGDRSDCEVLDAKDWTWKQQRFTPAPGGWARSGFIDSARRLMITHVGASTFYAHQLTNTGLSSAAPVALNITGPRPDGGSKLRWVYRPTDDCWYALPGHSYERRLFRLRPPANNPLTNPWVAEAISLSSGNTATSSLTGGNIPVQSAGSETDGSFHCSRLMYVPAIDCLAWIPANPDGGFRSAGTRVYLIKP